MALSENLEVFKVLSKQLQKVRTYFLRLLVRREYSQLELQGLGTDSTVIASSLAQLADDSHQSDKRFAEILCRTSINQCYGADKIGDEMRQKGIAKQVTDIEISKYSDEILDNAPCLPERRLPSAQLM